MKKAFTVLSLCTLLASLPVAAQTYSGGDGTETNPYKISSVADIDSLAAAVNSGTNYKGQFFQLQNNVSFSSTDTFTPIGKYESFRLQYQFAGTFDGNGHTISNVVYATAAANDRGAALFAYVDTAGVIKNLNLDAPQITANTTGSVNTAALVGQLYGTVDNCHVTNAVIITSASGYKGGLVGISYNGVITNSSFSGSITTANNVGGIVGQNYGIVHNCHSDATISIQSTQSTIYAGGIAGVTLDLYSSRGGVVPEITDCYFTGNISDPYGIGAGITGNLSRSIVRRCWNAGYIQSGNYTGGIAASVSNGGTIEDCYNVGTLYNTTTQYIGGIIGYNSARANSLTIKNVLSLGPIFDSEFTRGASPELIGSGVDGLDLQNVWFDEQIVGLGGTTGSKTTQELTNGEPLTGFADSVWTFTKGLYPRLKNTANLDIAKLNATPIYITEGQHRGHVTSDFTVSNVGGVEWELTGATSQAKLNGTTVNVTRGSQPGDVVLHSYLGNEERRSLVTIYPKMFDGDGTAASPYLINNAADLKKLADATNNQNMTFRNEYFAQTADIDLQNDTTFKLIADHNEYPFGGNYNGQGHKIKNWKFDNSNTNQLWSGLFSIVGKTGVIRNLVIDKSCSLNFYRNGAPVTAYLLGRVDSVYNYADVHSRNGFAGGIAYIIYGGGSVTNSYNAGNIISDEENGCLGGIAYSVEQGGTISNCQNSGSILGFAGTGNSNGNVGGIVGSSRGTIDNVLNTGLVYAYQGVGGIVGAANSGSELSNALSVGAVTFTTGSDEAGAVAGQNTSSAKYSNVVFDQQTAVYANIASDGVTGKNTADIIAADFGGSAWTHTAGGYPQLAQFKDNDGAALGTVGVQFKNGENRTLVSSPAYLPKATGITYSLKSGAYFTIDGDSLKLKSTPSGVIADTLVLTKNGSERLIPVGAMGKILPGEGTADEPYIIKTASDLVKLSDAINSGINFSGSYFSVANDIDMTGTSLTPIGNSDNKFSGIFNGNGYTLSNLSISQPGVTNVGLFGAISVNGVVENLAVSGTISGRSSVAAIAGTCEGTVRNVVNNASVTSSSSDAAGIVGTLSGENARIDSVANFGTITGNSGYVGGIVSTVEGATITNAINSGVVNAPSGYAGGIAGRVNHGATISTVMNTDSINGHYATGGIVGYSSLSSAYPALELSYAINSGAVTSENSYAGGIVANGGSTTNKLIVNEVANTGNVESQYASTSKTSTSAAAGGIVAYGVPTITDAYNAGSVKAQNFVGEVLGTVSSSYSNYSIDNVVLTGELSQTANNIGVVAGKVSKYGSVSGAYYDNKFVVGGDANDTTSTGLATEALVAQKVGDKWTNDNVGYPRIASLSAYDAYLAGTMPVLLSDSDNYLNVTKAFKVAVADGYTWTGDSVFTIVTPNVDLKGKGDYTISVEKGGYKFTRVLTINNEAGTVVTGINAITVNGGENRGVLDVSKPMFNIAGQRVGASYRGVVIQNGKKYILR